MVASETRKEATMSKASTDFNYIMRKIAHMKRLGLVSGSNAGFGRHGGACPDWLRAEQKAEDDRQ